MDQVATARGHATAAGFEAARADCYALLAALLGPPTPELLSLLRKLTWDVAALPSALQRALAALRAAAREAEVTAVEEDYRALFVGLGAGELVPYASWYRERTLQAAPLAAIRGDLARLGIVRVHGSHEPEDGAAALCEAMALISRNGGGLPGRAQAQFFRDHVAPWMSDFFADLRASRPAGFYGAVGDLGNSYLDAERAFLGTWGPGPTDGRKVQRCHTRP